MQPTPTPSPHEVARCLRHEVGDLLQTVYAVVAVFQERLPPDWTLERGILTSLRARAERTRDMLDMVHDLVSSPAPNPAAVDLGQLVEELTAAARGRHPERAFRTEMTPTQPRGDAQQLARLGTLLLEYAAQASPRGALVQVKPAPSADEVEWIIRGEEGSIQADHLETLTAPFSRPGYTPGRLALALARQLTVRQGGKFSAENLPGGGFEIRITLPAAGAAP